MVICRLDQLRPGTGLSVCLDTPHGPLSLAVFRCRDGVRAFLNRCPHQGRPLNWAPDEFLFDASGWLVCPHHGACFDLQSGHCEQGPCQGAGLQPVPVELRGADVCLPGGFRTTG